MEILHTYVKADDMFPLWFMPILFGLLSGLLSWAFVDEKKLIRGGICAAISALLIFFAASVIQAHFSGEFDRTYHEILITDMSAFDTDKFEIIEQRGKVFVVKEVAH